MADVKRPHETSGDKPIPTHAAPPPPRQSETQSQTSSKPPRPTPSDSQKREIADYFRSQGKQPEDAIWEFQGLKLLLRDLD